MRIRSLICSTIVLALLLFALPAVRSQSGPLYTVQQRIGVGVVNKYGAISDYDIASLHIGWYMDWSYNPSPPRPGGVEYAQVVRTGPGAFPPDWNRLSEAVRANPGALWFLGNEPDAAPGLQDCQSPESYAAAYHDLYTFIKGIDPTARVGPGGVIQPTPLRLRYLDMVLASYQAQYGTPFPADFWATHVQILQERRGDWGAGIPQGIPDDEGRLYSIEDNANPDIFEQLVWETRRWMAQRGMRNKELIISEYGVLMPSLYLCYCYDYAVGDAMVIVFMRRTFDFLLTAKDPELGCPSDEYRLVQRWSWYSLNEKPYDWPPYGEGYNGPLFDHRYPQYPGVLTVFGRAFRDYTSLLFPPFRRYFPLTVQAQ